MKAPIRIVVSVVCVSVVFTAVGGKGKGQTTAFDPTLWLEDFRQLQLEMATHYADLEFAVQDRRMDLPRLRKETEAKLRNAPDERTAQRAIEKFLASFGDGHLEIRWVQPHTSAKPEGDTAPNLCQRLGYNSPLKPGLDFSTYSGFTPLDTEDAKSFPGGLLRLPNGKIMGTIRIGLFTEHAFPEVCEAAAKTLHLADDSKCDQDCENKLEVETANALTASLSKRADALRTAGATALLIDITHNGGGSDWVDAVARELSSVPLRASWMAFLKHPHWTQNLQQQLNAVQTDIKNRAGDQTILHEAAGTLEGAIQETEQICQPVDVWDTGNLSCSMLVRNRLYVSGVLDYAKPGSFESLKSKTTLFHPARYAYSEDKHRLPLYVLVDRDTWSSAEYLAALLQDNHAATIVGETTGGAGCGYTNGGIPTKLKNSGAEVKMPDCVRLRADGSNEVNGIMPDVLVPWPREASDYQRVGKLVAVLGK